MRCPYFGRCGGCKHQDVPYEEQLERKRKELSYATGAKDIPIFSGPVFGYRNRMDFVFHEDGLGLRESKEKIVDVKRCLIANDRINELLSEVRSLDVDPFHQPSHTGTFRYAVIRAVKQSSISFVLNPDSPRLNDAIEKVRRFAEKTSAENVIVTRVKAKTDVSISSDYEAIKGSDMLEEEVMGNRFLFSVQGFFQNNSMMNERMHAYVHELLKNQDERRDLLDLYGGVGTFGINNSCLFSKVHIVESLKECIRAAENNVNKHNTEVIHLDAKDLPKLKLEKGQHVITDPPRSGMHPQTVQAIRRLEPKTIVYVSCNLQELSKDIRNLGYQVKSAALFDLFPHTPHSEAVVELTGCIGR
mgnify:CR=1 FL=1